MLWGNRSQGKMHPIEFTLAYLDGLWAQGCKKAANEGGREAMRLAHVDAATRYRRAIEYHERAGNPDEVRILHAQAQSAESSVERWS